MKADQSKIVPIVEPELTAIHHAIVVSVNAASITIDAMGIEHTAKKAFSCLVQPELNDVVMFSRHETGINYILGIIERPESNDMTLNFSGDAKLQASSGSLTMLSSDSVNLLAAKSITQVSHQAIYKSQEAIIDYNDVTAQGENLQASFTNVRVFSQLMSTMAKQVIDKFKSYIRHTEDFDQVKAAQMTREVSGLYSMDSKHTIMVSKKDTKIDGERIHMG